MAQLLTPVCADPFKLQNSVQKLNTHSSTSRRSVFSTRHYKWRGMDQSRKRDSARVKAVVEESTGVVDDFADDYYAVLGLTPDATLQEIRKAYYNCMKACHPDLSGGDDPETTNFCKFINEVYEVLSDPVQRMVYDDIYGYSLTAINPFMDDSSPRDHVFVDEFSCIGCKNCANVASDVFRIEEDFGRARVYKQCGVSDHVEQAIQSCPVDCIHLTSAAQLSLLEDEMRRVERINVALMLSGMGASSDVFRMANSRWEKRQSKILEKEKFRMTKQKGTSGVESYWDNLWGKPKDYQSSEEEVQERAKRAAEAARRWREYSRKRTHKRSTYKLPDAVEVSKE